MPALRLALLWSTLFVVVAEAQDIYYLPNEFPKVCAQRLSDGSQVCPAGVTTEAPAFCGSAAENLRAWASQKNLNVCGEKIVTEIEQWSSIHYMYVNSYELHVGILGREI